MPPVKGRGNKYPETIEEHINQGAIPYVISVIKMPYTPLSISRTKTFSQT